MEKETKKGISMMAAASEALKYKKNHADASREEIMNHVSKLIEKEKNPEAKLGMVAAASKALDISEREEIADRVVLNRIMTQLPEMMQSISE